MVYTEISKRVDGKFNVWGLIKDEESPTMKDMDGKPFHYRYWSIVGVAENANEAKGIQRNFRFSNR